MYANEIVFDAQNPNKIDLEKIEIKEIKTDSREVGPGDLFVAIKGHTVDAHDFIDQVTKKDVALILANSEMQDELVNGKTDFDRMVFVENTYDYLSVVMNRFLDFPSQKLNVFGVTGTNGKTSTANILTEILNKAGKKTGVIGTMGVTTSKNAYALENTTPDPLVLQNVFGDMVNDGMENTVMEVSSIGLSENRTKLTDFSVAIFTNLSQDHLDFHQTMENYREAKGILFSELKKTNSRGEENVAIINIDDATADYFIEQAQAKVLTYGLNNPADYRATDIHYSESETHFVLHHMEEEYNVQIPLIGEFNVYNVLAAIAAAHAKGIALEQIIPILKNIQPVAGRLEILTSPTEDDISVIVDFAHTPDSLEKSLQIFQDIEHEEIISVFGCGGDRDASKRPIMAQIGVNNSDLAIFTADNPRTENQDDIFEDMEVGLEGDNYIKIDDRGEAIAHAIKNANKGDVILIAGKGHEDYQIVGTEKTHFDDREEARKALSKRRKRV